MNKYVNSAYITLDNNNGIPMYVCKIVYTLFDNDEFMYEFYPNYRVIDLLDADLFQGIPGLNLDLRKEVYTRKNIVPVFISERVPQNNRDDLYDLLKEVNMDYMEPITYLLRTNLQYFGDNFYLEKEDDILNDKHYESVSDLGINFNNILYKILKEIGKGNRLYFNNFKIDETNYRDIYCLLNSLLTKHVGYLKKSGLKRGRKRKDSNYNEVCSLIDEYINNLKSREEVQDILQISPATFYRYLKEFRKNEKSN